MAFIDARGLPDASPIEADLIIVGGGMAGITLARELAGGALKVPCWKAATARST